MKSSGSNLLYANGHRYTWVTLLGLEQTCRTRMDMVSCSSDCLELKRIRTSMLHENGHCYMRFQMFGDETKWKKLVACEWTPLRVGHADWIGTNLSHAIGHGFV